MFKNLRKRFLSYFNKNLGSSQRYTGFTLAEVLITLGIIGIVAAMTIPTLINNTQKQQYVTALKKFYTTMDNGFEQMLAADGVEQLDDTDAFSSITHDPYDISDCDININPSPDCQTFFKDLHKYFNFTIQNTPSDYSISSLDPGYGYVYNYGNNPVMLFADGSIILGYSTTFYSSSMADEDSHEDADATAKIKAAGGHMMSSQGNITVDVNGFKKPNTFGRDIFSFGISGDGKLYSYGSNDMSIFISYNLNNTWKDHNDCGSDENSTNISGSFGSSCAARIIEAGWKMNY